MQITGVRAVVTGAASGLGLATAQALAAHGAAVTAIDLASAIERADPVDGIAFVAADVTDEDEVRRALAADQRSGPLRIVVNCAGIAPSARIVSSNGVHELGLFQKVIAVNLVGTFNVLRLAAEVMADSPPDADGQRGLIVNTASVAAYEGQVGQVAYAASKGGVVAMTLAAARDLARHGIRVDTIAPGIVATPMMASFGDDVQASLASSVPFPARLARPEEFAQLVIMLCEHDYLNGETIRMDGALRMAPQ